MDNLEYSSGQYHQAFTIKSNKPCRLRNFQEYPRCSQNLGYLGSVSNQLFAMLLEVILREIRSIFNQTYLFIHFFAGIIYHLIAYDLKIEENVRNLCFG